MERSIRLLLKQNTLAQPVGLCYFFSNLLHVAANTIQFFLVPYFVFVLKFSMLQGGVLLSCYGVGAFLATYFTSSMDNPKKPFYALLGSTFSLSNFLMMTSFVPLIFNVLLLGLSCAVFKKSIAHFAYKEAKSLYLSSELGLGLALLAILAFSVVDFKIGFLVALILNILSLVFGWIASRETSLVFSGDNSSSMHPKKNSATVYLGLLFLGGLLLSQLTATYGLYLASHFSYWGIKALAIFMLTHAVILWFLQKPILFVFNRSDPLFRSGYGALLLGLGCFSFNLGHVLTVVLFSAMVYSLGELFFIGALYKACRDHHILPYFTKTLTLSLIVGASLGTCVYQYCGARTLWQACALLGVLCFGLGVLGMCLRNKIDI